MGGMEIRHREVFLTLGYLLITEKLMFAVELLSGKHHHSSFKGIWSLAVCPVQLSLFNGWGSRTLWKPFRQFRSMLSLKLLS